MKRKHHIRGKRLAAGWALGLGAFLAVLTVVVSWWLGPVVRRAGETFGPQLLGVPVQIEHVDVKTWRGRAVLRGVAIGNPEGFETPQMFELGELRIVLSLTTLLTDTVHIHELSIRDPRVTYELRGRQSNIGVLLDGLEKSAGEAEETPARKIIVDRFLFEGGRLGFSTILTGGRAVTVPLPTIELQDLGKRSGGLAGVELALQITRSIATSIASGVVEASGQLVGSGAELLKQAASGGTDALLGIAGGATGLAGEVAGTVGTAGRRATESAGRAIDSLLGRNGDTENQDRE